MMARGDGTTSAAMLSAPHGAYYVWCTKDTSYPRALSAHLGRSDLVIVPSIWVGRESERVPRDADIVIDHAFRYLMPPFSYEQRLALEVIESRQDRLETRATMAKYSE